MQAFLDNHKFGQRNTGGIEQPVDFTHQPTDILHEEMIRLQIVNLDKNRLVRNAETSRMERDSEVFTQSARLLGFFGEEFVKTTEYNRTLRKYEKFYKQVLAIRNQIRKSGFLSDFSNPKQPFYSLDLKTEMHPHLHNFKLKGEENFKSALEHLATGNGYQNLPCNVQPKTLEEEEKISKRNELSKEELFKNLIQIVKGRLEVDSEDSFLLDTFELLNSKKPQSFNPKSVLVELCSKVNQYIENLVINDIVEDLTCEAVVVQDY